MGPRLLPFQTAAMAPVVNLSQCKNSPCCRSLFGVAVARQRSQPSFVCNSHCARCNSYSVPAWLVCSSQAAGELSVDHQDGLLAVVHCKVCAAAQEELLHNQAPKEPVRGDLRRSTALGRRAGRSLAWASINNHKLCRSLRGGHAMCVPVLCHASHVSHTEPAMMPGAPCHAMPCHACRESHEERCHASSRRKPRAPDMRPAMPCFLRGPVRLTCGMPCHASF